MVFSPGDDYSLHPTLGHWLRTGYPVVICTDDTTLFGITLSDELARVAIAFGLSYTEVAQLAIGGTSAIFDVRSEVARTVVERCERGVHYLLSALDGESLAAARGSTDSGSAGISNSSNVNRYRTPRGIEVVAGQALRMEVVAPSACAPPKCKI